MPLEKYNLHLLDKYTRAHRWPDYEKLHKERLMTEAPTAPPKPQDQTPILDPQDTIHAKVLALDEMGLHLRRAELKDRTDLNLDELTELCAVLAQLRRKKSGPPSGATTRKRISTPPKVDVKKLEF